MSIKELYGEDIHSILLWWTNEYDYRQSLKSCILPIQTNNDDTIVKNILSFDLPNTEILIFQDLQEKICSETRRLNIECGCLMRHEWLLSIKTMIFESTSKNNKLGKKIGQDLFDFCNQNNLGDVYNCCHQITAPKLENDHVFNKTCFILYHRLLCTLQSNVEPFNVKIRLEQLWESYSLASRCEQQNLYSGVCPFNGFYSQTPASHQRKKYNKKKCLEYVITSMLLYFHKLSSNGPITGRSEMFKSWKIDFEKEMLLQSLSVISKKPYLQFLDSRNITTFFPEVLKRIDCDEWIKSYSSKLGLTKTINVDIIKQFKHINSFSHLAFVLSVLTTCTSESFDYYSRFHFFDFESIMNINDFKTRNPNYILEFSVLKRWVTLLTELTKINKYCHWQIAYHAEIPHRYFQWNLEFPTKYSDNFFPESNITGQSIQDLFHFYLFECIAQKKIISTSALSPSEEQIIPNQEFVQLNPIPDSEDAFEIRVKPGKWKSLFPIRLPFSDPFFYMKQENIEKDCHRSYCPSPNIRYLQAPAIFPTLTDKAKESITLLFKCELSVHFIAMFHDPKEQFDGFISIDYSESTISEFKEGWANPISLLSKIIHYSFQFYNDDEIPSVSNYLNEKQLRLACKIQQILSMIQEHKEPWLLPIPSEHFHCLGVDKALFEYNTYLTSLGYTQECTKPQFVDEIVYLWMLENLYPVSEFEQWTLINSTLKHYHDIASEKTFKTLEQVYKNAHLRNNGSIPPLEDFYKCFLNSCLELARSKCIWSNQLFTFALNNGLDHLYPAYFKQLETFINLKLGNTNSISFEQDLAKKHYDLRWVDDLSTDCIEALFPHYIWKKNPRLFFKDTEWWSSIPIEMKEIERKEKKLVILQKEFNDIQGLISSNLDVETTKPDQVQQDIDSKIPNRKVKFVEIFPDLTCPTGFSIFQDGYKQCYESKILKKAQKLVTLKQENTRQRTNGFEFKKILSNRSQLSEKEIQTIFAKWIKICREEKPYIFPALLFMIFDAFLELYGFKTNDKTENNECCFINPWRNPNLNDMSSQFGMSLLSSPTESVRQKQAYIHFKTTYEKRFWSFLNLITKTEIL